MSTPLKHLGTGDAGPGILAAAVPIGTIAVSSVTPVPRESRAWLLRACRCHRDRRELRHRAHLLRTRRRPCRGRARRFVGVGVVFGDVDPDEHRRRHAPFRMNHGRLPSDSHRVPCCSHRGHGRWLGGVVAVGVGGTRRLLRARWPRVGGWALQRAQLHPPDVAATDDRPARLRLRRPLRLRGRSPTSAVGDRPRRRLGRCRRARGCQRGGGRDTARGGPRPARDTFAVRSR